MKGHVGGGARVQRFQGVGCSVAISRFKVSWYWGFGSGAWTLICLVTYPQNM